jgi:hypothetical protein
MAFFGSPNLYLQLPIIFQSPHESGAAREACWQV